MADSDVVHVRHSLDGYPLCWPMDQDGDFRGEFDAQLASCIECKRILEEPS